MSCDPNVIKGRELVFLIRTDDELTFEVLGGVTERGFDVSNPMDEVTSSSTTGEWTEEEWTGYSQMTMNISINADKRFGQVDAATGFNVIDFNRILKLGTSGNRCMYAKLISTDPAWNFYAEGYFNITNINQSGATPGLLTGSATITSKSNVIVQAGA